jgi:hypothetical protein
VIYTQEELGPPDMPKGPDEIWNDDPPQMLVWLGGGEGGEGDGREGAVGSLRIWDEEMDLCICNAVVSSS